MATTAKLSLQEYEKIVASGVFDWPNQRHIELIHGELREMNPIGPDHAEIVDRLSQWSFRNVPDKVRVRVQNPLGLADLDSEPQPDLSWVRQQSYAKAHPTSADVLLVIEVADSSLDRDRTEKLDLYAEAGIQEYWLVNLIDRVIEVYREPVLGRYNSVGLFAAHEIVHPLAAPSIGISFDDLLFG